MSPKLTDCESERVKARFPALGTGCELVLLRVLIDPFAILAARCDWPGDDFCTTVRNTLRLRLSPERPFVHTRL